MVCTIFYSRLNFPLIYSRFKLTKPVTDAPVPLQSADLDAGYAIMKKSCKMEISLTLIWIRGLISARRVRHILEKENKSCVGKTGQFPFFVHRIRVFPGGHNPLRGRRGK
jgi:hypothetical protein